MVRSWNPKVGCGSDFEHSPAVKFHYRDEAWKDPEGMVPLRARRYETRMDIPVLDMHQAELADGQVARPGADLASATPAWIGPAGSWGEGSGAVDLPLVTRAPAPVPDVPLERTITTRLLVTCTVVPSDQIPA